MSREYQKQFAREIINISDHDKSPNTLTSLNKLSYLLLSQVGEDNGIAIGLSEYLYELKEIAEGGEDTGWKDQFKKTLDEDLAED